MRAWIAVAPEQRWHQVEGLRQLADLGEPVAVTVVLDAKQLGDLALRQGGLDALPAPLEEIRGVSVGIRSTGEGAIEAHARLVTQSRDAAVVRAFGGRGRSPVARLPGPAVAGISTNVAPRKLYELIEQIVSTDAYAREDFEQLDDAVDEVLDMDLDDVLDACSGAQGLVLREWPRGGDVRRLELLSWVGLSDDAVGLRFVDELVEAVEDEGFDGVDRDEVKGTPVYTFDMGVFSRWEAGLAVHGSYLLGATDAALVEDVVRGERDPIRRTTPEAARVLGSSAAVSAWVDLTSYFAAYDDELEREFDIEDLDFEDLSGSFEATIDVAGASLVGRARLRMDLSVFVASFQEPMERYRRRQMTTEATMNLRKLYDGSVVAFVVGEQEGRPMFPPSSRGRFPADLDLGRSCNRPARTTGWEANPAWNALNFAVSDPHWYSYQYDSHGFGEGAQFTASAFGDLDCDGEYSTFVRFGIVENGEVRGSAGLYIANELE